MILAKATFEQKTINEHSREDIADEIDSYLSFLLKNGQIYQNDLFAWINKTPTAYVYLASSEATLEKHHSQYGKQQLNQLAEKFGITVRWQILDDDIPEETISWQSVTAFVLTTSMFEHASPVCQLSDGREIPIFSLPLSDQEREGIYFWQKSYHNHDEIWLASGDLETAAYKQLAEATSELSKSGRDLCAKIEQATEKPTYYYLCRYFGRRRGEELRLCPGCGKAWRVVGQSKTENSFWAFDYKCEACRLVSHLASSQEDERRAVVGEYKKSSM